MTVNRADVDCADGDAALSSSTPPPLWKRMTAEYQTSCGGEKDLRWLLDESSRLVALSQKLQNHANSLSRRLTELLRRPPQHASPDSKHDVLSEICRSSTTLINDARALSQAATAVRRRGHGFAALHHAATRPATAEPPETDMFAGHDEGA